MFELKNFAAAVICPRLLQSWDQSQIFALRLTRIWTIRRKEKVPLPLIFLFRGKGGCGLLLSFHGFYFLQAWRLRIRLVGVEEQGIVEVCKIVIKLNMTICTLVVYYTSNRFWHLKSSTMHSLCQSPTMIRSAEQHGPWSSRRSDRHFPPSPTHPRSCSSKILQDPPRSCSPTHPRSCSTPAKAAQASRYSGRLKSRKGRGKRCSPATTRASPPQDCRTPCQAKRSSKVCQTYNNHPVKVNFKRLFSAESAAENLFTYLFASQ